MGFFNRVNLQTPESVELEFTLAGIGNRAYALIVDYIVLGLTLIVFFIGWTVLSLQFIGVLEDFITTAEDIQLWLLAIQLLIAFAIYVGYFVFFEVLWQGQTPGKRYVKIRVIRDDGRPVGLQQATLRALLHPIDDFFFLGAFLIIFTKQEKRVGDWIAGTLVIQEERPALKDKFAIAAQAHSLAKQLKEQADISQLLPEHFIVIRDYLQRREIMIPEARREVARKLAYEVKDAIALAEVPDGVTANAFLEAVYLAYQDVFSRD